MHSVSTPTAEQLEVRLEQHRAELTAHCHRMLASRFEAEDAVQETLVRAWRSLDRFERRASLRAWLYRIATNVCLDMLDRSRRRPTLIDLHAEPTSGGPVAPNADAAEVAIVRETARRAIAVLQELPPRQRAVLFLCKVLGWTASEAAELLDTTVPSVNSALQRARATLRERPDDETADLDRAQQALLARYVEAFEAYDVAGLTSIIGEDTRH
jgi:RNA polymerase sigma-70 factor (ECF subfamily)